MLHGFHHYTIFDNFSGNTCNWGAAQVNVHFTLQNYHLAARFTPMYSVIILRGNGNGHGEYLNCYGEHRRESPSKEVVLQCKMYIDSRHKLQLLPLKLSTIYNDEIHATNYDFDAEVVYQYNVYLLIFKLFMRSICTRLEVGKVIFRCLPRFEHTCVLCGFFQNSHLSQCAQQQRTHTSE